MRATTNLPGADKLKPARDAEDKAAKEFEAARKKSADAEKQFADAEKEIQSAPSTAYVPRMAESFPSVSTESNSDITDCVAAWLVKLGFETERLDYLDERGVKKSNILGRKGPVGCARRGQVPPVL